MEIVLNKESKRKTPAAIAFRNEERTVGDDALTVGVKFPKNMYAYLLDLLGKSMDNPMVRLYQQRFPHYQLVEDPVRKTVLFQHDAETQFAPEELVAMILSKAKEYAEQFAGQQIKECVITAPAFFNQAERRAMLRAAELAGIKVLQLINSNIAAALDYGIFRRKDFNESAQNILFYDMGASSTVATVASYQVVKTKDKGYTEYHPQVSVLGLGYDRTLGGLEMQVRLRDHLARAFNAMKKTKTDVFSNPRAMSKLFKEAGRVKNILSANSDHFAQVENLLDEQDFRLKVTRDELEQMSADLMERVAGPLERALASAKMSMEQVDHLIIVGAGTRMPKVQETLTKLTGRDLGKNLNADEAAALGAVYRAADLSTGFQVKKFLTKDAVVFPIVVDFERELDPDEEGNKVIKVVKRTLFPAMNPYPQKKVLTFNKHHEDFSFYVNYGNLSAAGLSDSEAAVLGPVQLSRVDLKGIDAALTKHQQDGVEFKGIKAHFAVDDSGLLSLSTVETTFEKTHPVVAEEPATEAEGAAAADSADATNSTNATDATNATNSSKSDAKDKKEKKPKIETLKEDLDKVQVQLDVPDLEGDQFQAAQKRIVDLNEKDRIRREKEQAKNGLEGFILDTQDKLTQPEFEVLVTESEKTNIMEKCSELSDWLYEEGDDAETSVYAAKTNELKRVTDDMFERHREHRDRPEVVAAFQRAVNVSNTFMLKIRSSPPDEKYLEDDDLDALDAMLQENAAWLDRKLAEQEKVPLHQAPVVTLKNIAEKMAVLDKEVKVLINKAKVARTKRLKELADKLKEFEKKKNETEKEKATDAEEAAPPSQAEEPATEKVPDDTKTSSSSTTDSLDDDEHVEL